MDYKYIAEGYHELHQEEQQYKLALVKSQLSIKERDKLLDVGCGTGLSSDFNCYVVGIDPCKELLEQNEVANEIVLGRVEELPFEDESFDTVIALTSLHNADDFEGGLQEIKRVGKNQFAFSILKKSKLFDEIDAAIKKHFTIKKLLDAKQDWLYICSK